MNLLIIIAALSLQMLAHADSIQIQVNGAGQEVKWEDFVVFADKCDLQKELPQIMIDQKNCQYEPFVSVTSESGLVQFKNGDRISHNAFALSPNSFDLGTQKIGQIGKTKLKGIGITRVQCRFHPKMIAEILVVKNACFAKLKQGSAIIEGVPSGENTIRVWSPHLKKVITASGTGKISINIQSENLSIVNRPADCPSTPMGYN